MKKRKQQECSEAIASKKKRNSDEQARPGLRPTRHTTESTGTPLREQMDQCLSEEWFMML